MATKSFRLRFAFWLDMCKPEEEGIAETIAELKQQRSFASAIRDGIRLVTDLRAGQMEVLFELFPWVRAEFLEYMATVQPQKSEAELVIAEQLARIETILDSADQADGSSGVGGAKKLNVPPVPAPAFEDDDSDLLFVAQSDSASNATQNFLNSISRLQ